MPQIDSCWIRTKSDEIAIDKGCYFDMQAADRVRYFFERFLRHSKGEFAGKKFELLPWQWENVIAPAFGWKCADGTRRFRKVGVAVPKKNGKSTLLSGVGLYMLAGDSEPGAEIYSAAADRDQASIIYNEAANMVEASPALSKYLAVLRSRNKIDFPSTRSVYKSLSADVPTKDGLNIHCLLFDELHTQKTSDLWDTLRYGGIARRQPLLFWITTAGKDRNTLCGIQWAYARGIQESRIIDTEFLPYICETDEDADWTKEETWKVANPSYGITLSARDFISDCKEAENSVITENNFKRYRLNMWTRQDRRWIPLNKWDANTIEVDLESLKKYPCYIGLDLASTSDLCSASLVFKKRKKDVDELIAVPYYWLPEESLLRRRQVENLTKLDVWADDGYIKLTSGGVADYKQIRADLNSIADQFDVKFICIDPWNATQLATDLLDDGFKVEFVRQGYTTISAAAKEFEKRIINGTLYHTGNPVFTWQIGNVAIEEDASGNIKPSKKLSSEKIDGVTATITAIAKIIEDQAKPSKYENQKLTTITIPLKRKK
jgi:phage terminase large subunit-like protein